MKIEELKIQGYRSLYDVTWKPGDLNVLIGPNASGKTNLLKFLELLSASAKGKLGNYIIREGGFEAISWDSISNKIFTFLKTTSSEKTPQLIYRINISKLGNTNNYNLNKESLTFNTHPTTIGMQLELLLLIRDKSQDVIHDKNNESHIIKRDNADMNETLLSVSNWGTISNPTTYEFHSFLSQISILRLFSTDQNSQIRMPSVSRYENQVASDGQNLISVLHTLYTTDREFKKELNITMKVAFGDDFDELVFPPDADQRVQLRLRWKSLKKERSAADLSDGTLRFLLLMAVLANPKPAPLIAIDEPEIGLHPSMLPIIAEFAVEASRKTQVIFATHSPEFLGAFRDTIPTTTVAKLNEGKTELKTISGEDLSKWLKEYTLGELMKTGELEAMG